MYVSSKTARRCWLLLIVSDDPKMADLFAIIVAWLFLGAHNNQFRH